MCWFIWWSWWMGSAFEIALAEVGGADLASGLELPLVTTNEMGVMYE